jgi:hypothetical protein
VELTLQPDRPAEFTEYDGVPEPMLITASGDAADPESAATSVVVVGLQVIERVANPTLIVSVIGADCEYVALDPATTWTAHVPAAVNTNVEPLENEQFAVPAEVTE